MILAIDAGFLNMGWTLFVGGAPVAHGCIITKGMAKKHKLYQADDDARRCQVLFRELNLIVRNDGIPGEQKIDGVVCELPSGGAQGARSLRCMALGSAVVACFCESRLLAVDWITPMEVKLAAMRILRKMPKTKADMIEAAKKRFPEAVLNGAPATHEHIADSMLTYVAAEAGNVVRGQ